MKKIIKKLFILGIIAMFFGISLVSIGSSISIEKSLEKSNTKTDDSWEGKWFIITVRDKETYQKVSGAYVDIWDVPQKNAGVRCQGYTNILGKFSTKELGRFEYRATVFIHAEATIGGERKVFNEEVRSSTSGPIHKTVYLDEPQGKSKDMSNLFESQFFNRLLSIFSIFKNLQLIQ